MSGYWPLRLGLFGFLVLMGWTVPAQAQVQARTFEELRSFPSLIAEDTIEITDENGAKYKGRLEQITTDTLAFTVKGVRRELRESQVREIRHRRRDSLWNGALIGLGVGVGLAAAAFASDECYCSAGEAIFGTAFIGASSMGIGALIDFAVRRTETAFARPGSGASQRLRISPIVNQHGKGVRLVVAF